MLSGSTEYPERLQPAQLTTHNLTTFFTDGLGCQSPCISVATAKQT
jgi:hypothetical protein